ncbi:hypothetical protein ACH5RR_013403 [Cinchona calisaya]|uniref:Uncharacterized protein n=1 Tax=Cinchona calisaya TaxID=153742 RepID=A0ABD2ZZY2_9GENT
MVKNRSSSRPSFPSLLLHLSLPIILLPPSTVAPPPLPSLIVSSSHLEHLKSSTRSELHKNICETQSTSSNLGFLSSTPPSIARPIVLPVFVWANGLLEAAKIALQLGNWTVGGNSSKDGCSDRAIKGNDGDAK